MLARSFAFSSKSLIIASSSCYSLVLLLQVLDHRLELVSLVRVDRHDDLHRALQLSERNHAQTINTEPSIKSEPSITPFNTCFDLTEYYESLMYEWA